MVFCTVLQIQGSSMGRDSTSGSWATSASGAVASWTSGAEDAWKCRAKLPWLRLLCLTPVFGSTCAAAATQSARLWM